MAHRGDDLDTARGKEPRRKRIERSGNEGGNRNDVWIGRHAVGLGVILHSLLSFVGRAMDIKLLTMSHYKLNLCHVFVKLS